MHSALLGLHNIVRWLVILTGVVALLRSYRGLLTHAAWTPRESVSLRAYALTASAQLALGVLLYFFSPLTPALSDFGGAMSEPGLRYFVVEHPLAMILAVALAHVALARTHKTASDGARFRTAAVLLTLSVVLVLAMTPWGRPLIPSF